MNVKELQTWLQKYGYYKGKIDGIAGRQTKEALRKAQQYLANAGLYKTTVDGLYGKQTEAAIRAWNNGYREFTRYGVRYNMYNRAGVRAAFDQLRKKGIGIVRMAGRKIDLNTNSAWDNFWSANEANKKGITLSDLPTDNMGTVASTLTGAITTKATQKAANGGGSSYNRNDLRNLVMRYAYDRFHGTDIDNNAWGIRYDYDPAHGGLNGGIDLYIDPKKYNANEAATIAIGAGLLNYRYGNKKVATNLFTGQKNFRDRSSFESYIQNLQNTKGAKVAQQAYNAELQRQYNTYGIDYNMLNQKGAYQWNSLFGAVPYGYNSESIAAIDRGHQATTPAGAKSTSWGTSALGYRYTGNGSKGRFEYNNFGEWYGARVLANRGGHNGGISTTRAATSMYSMGLPLDQRMRGEIQFLGANPNGNKVDYTNYYTLTNGQKGTAKMQAWVYNEAAKNPQAAYKYLQYIYGGQGKGFRSRKYDLGTADRLANAAGMTKYHRTSAGGGFNTGPHDVWESLKTFYDNGFDANGNLKKDFNYSENGYNNDYDGGAYTVMIRNGKANHAEDDWNIELAGISGGMNGGRNGRGIPLILRYNKQGGKLLSYISNFNIFI